MQARSHKITRKMVAGREPNKKDMAVLLLKKQVEGTGLNLDEFHFPPQMLVT